MLTVGLSFMASVCCVPSIITLLRVFFFFNHRWILYFVKRFSASIETILWFFLFFSLGMWWITWTYLQIWNHLCIPSINPTYLWCMILLMYFKFGFPYFVEDFCIYVHQWYWPVIFFLCIIFIWFWYQGDAGLVELGWKYFFLWKVLE